LQSSNILYYIEHLFISESWPDQLALNISVRKKTAKILTAKPHLETLRERFEENMD
jgi:hypothetical protein